MAEEIVMFSSQPLPMKFIKKKKKKKKSRVRKKGKKPCLKDYVVLLHNTYTLQMIFKLLMLLF